MADFSGPLRSVLYLPASNSRAVRNARSLDCDALIFDLEDAVAPHSKAAARGAAVEATRSGGYAHQLMAIRVNSLDTPWGQDDFLAAAESEAEVIVVPKLDGADNAAQAVLAARGKSVWAMIESPRAVLSAASIARTDGVAALVAGTADLANELHATPGLDRSPLLYALSIVVNAARAFGRLAFDGVHTDIDDFEGLECTSRQGAALGFDGRTIVHPTHIEIANLAYSPTEESIQDAADLIRAHQLAVLEGQGVTSFKGKLVEALHVDQAKRLLALAQAIGRRN